MRLSLVSLATCVGTSLALGQQAPTGGADAPKAADPGQQTGAVIEIPGLQKLRIGGQYRLRYENRYNYDFNDDVTDNDDFFTQRFRLDLDFKFNDQISAFVQMQDVRFWGEETGSTTSRAAPGFDFHQAYLQVGDFPGIGGEARIGRQQLSYGSERLIGALDWLSQARAFDGFRQSWARKDSYRYDAFATQIKENPSVKNTYDDAWFFGAYGTWLVEKGAADLYVLFRHDNMTATPGLENRLTVGGRYMQRLGAFEFEAEAATQWGEKDGNDIPIGKTYAAHLHGRFYFEGDLAPFVQVDGDLASGDDPGTTDDERFDTLYPTAHRHLGMMDYVFWENIMHLGASLGVKPSAKTRLEVAWHYFKAMEETDRVSGPNGTLTTGGVGFSDELGHEIDLLYNLDIGTTPVKTAVQIGYGIFMPGDGVKDSMAGDDLAHFVYVQGNASF